MPDIPLGQYQHYKGNKYEVLGIVRHSEDESLLVLYKPLYKQKDGSQDLWVRPFDMFIEKVTINNREIDRFKFIGNSA